MSLDLFAEDVSLQESGAECAVNQMSFFVRRFGNQKSWAEYREIKSKIYGPLARQDQVDDSLIIAHWLCEYGVTNWLNVSASENDELIEYSKAECVRIFTDEKYKISLNVILWAFANNYENYLLDESEKEIEEVKKK